MLPVLGDQAVLLVLDVAELRVDGGAKALFRGGDDAVPVQGEDGVAVFGFGFEELIAVPFAVGAVGIAAELRKHERARTAELGQRFEIEVIAVHVGLRLPEPAGGRIDDPRRVRGFQKRIHCVGMVLSPALVEDRPVGDAGAVVKMPDGLEHGLLEDRLCARGKAAPEVVLFLESDRRQHGVADIAVGAVVDKILEHDDAEPVAS